MPAPGSGAADTSSSASAIFEGRVSGHHVLHIENYSRTKERLPNHTSINSRPLRVGGYSWYLCYFPNGESSENADYISVFLCLEQSATGRVKALARLSLLDRAGKPVPSHTREAEVFEYAADESYGFFDFIKRDFLEASEHLKDDCFRIRCDIFIPEGLLTEDRAAFVDVPPSDMHQHFRDLLKSKDGADVTFRVGGEICRAHRYILGARSPVFKAELLGTMRESTATEDCIQIDDMLPQARPAKFSSAMPAPGSGAADAEDPSSSASASAIFAGTATGHHVLHIENYSRTKEELPNGSSVKSRPFQVGGSSCATQPVKARAKYSLLDRAGKPVLSQTKSTPSFEYSVAGPRYGFYDFIKRDFLEASEHLKDDCFKIRCDIFIPKGLSTEDRAAAPNLFADVPASDMHQHFGYLLSSKDGADVTFRVGVETFRAHRYILGVRSPVFKAKLLGKMKESTATGDCIQIDDMLPQVFKALLYFIYTDSWQEMEEQEEAVMAQHLLEAADRYDMKRLKLICENNLYNHLEVSTAATTLVLAEQHNCQGLKEACMDFLISPDALEAVMETDGFEHLTKSCPALVKELVSKLADRLYKRRKLSA
ncbi:unnamed protein product [Urochloa decumbens]|uniref:Uncharacterized protein n=1 Tax=Urochloa decumbens TaxID=240449 RepID=A0ABC8Y096_9POAL